MILEANELEKTVGLYKKENIVDGVSFALNEGEVMGMLGPNGAGKTTTMKMLLGLISISSGYAEMMNAPVPTPESRIGVGFLPEVIQHPDYLTVEEYLKFHAKLNGISNVDGVVEDCLKKVNMLDRRTRLLNLCSKGMRQRADIARIMLSNAKLVFLDEPFSGLDPLGQVMLKDIISLLKSQGISFLINSHAVGILEDVCDKVCIMNKGKILTDGKIADMLKTPDVLIKANFNSVKEAKECEKQFNGANNVDINNEGEFSITIQESVLSNEYINKIINAGGNIKEVVPCVLSLDKLFVKVLSEADKNLKKKEN